MTRILLFASTTVALAAGAVTAAQGPIVPPPKTPPQNSATFRDQQHAVTIVGCLYGDRFVADTTQHRMALELVQATEFTLTGPKNCSSNCRASTTVTRTRSRASSPSPGSASTKAIRR